MRLTTTQLRKATRELSQFIGSSSSSGGGACAKDLETKEYDAVPASHFNGAVAYVLQCDARNRTVRRYHPFNKDLSHISSTLPEGYDFSI
ncbi:MAG TPA: hypothetical protein VJJ79_02855 [Candidatus Nanoarchaeia archaeon]|nr:hypothetical protein [Candidatus Nanoarchaeia archaeon]